MSDTQKAEKEADHYPYRRPVDAATLILVDRAHDIPKVLVGKRHDKVVFMPGKFVFPGGRVDKADNRVPVAAPIPKALENNLLKGSPKITASRARSLAVAAIREACEETGLCLGRKSNGAAPHLEGAWKPFTDAGLLPDPSGLFLIARAITPPGRVRRFDARFFVAEATLIAHRAEGAVHPDAELVELTWIPIEKALELDIPRITRLILGDLAELGSTPSDRFRPRPFYRQLRAQQIRDEL